MSSRKTFLKQTALGLCALSAPRLLWSCSADPLKHIKGGITGANHATGHLLRNIAALPEPTESLSTDVLIIGAGVSGLSARRWISRHSEHRVLLLDMDEVTGGNARSGRNAVSAYPYAAHYLPIPDLRNLELIEFLRAAGCIVGDDERGLPIYNEYHLCQDPEERLFINGYWQEGLVPQTGISDLDKAEMQRFFSEVERLRILKGSDGKDAFAIPVVASSQDPVFAAWHDISFEDYLTKQGYRSKYLLWYLEYGCKDDYGALPAHVSAWAGLHYFASRKGKGSRLDHSALLTWPEGNGFLANALQHEGTGDILKGHLAYSVERLGDRVRVKTYDPSKKVSTLIDARNVILCTPVSVNKRLLHIEAAYEKVSPSSFQRAPWVIGNLTVSDLPQGKGMPLCWDNVLFGKETVGYVNANHQNLSVPAQRVITCYLPITGADTSKARQEASSRDFRYWLKRFVDELEIAHPGIAACISDADIWVWGHGMVRPSPGFFSSGQRELASAPIDDRIFFAHTDLSGISIFEEAFYQGIKAARQVLNGASDS